jgi:2-keto-4-pentenoate hydratase/2-oxohepta-3-ene-1,7-dioic acid hydratase in catechol pathway
MTTNESSCILPPLRLMSIGGAGRRETIGVVSQGDDASRGVFDVERASEALSMPAPLTLDALLRDGGWDRIEALQRAAAGRFTVAESSLAYGRLFTNPGKILCVGLNYRRHAAECKLPVPQFPVLFSKFNNALAPHGATLRLPPSEVASKFDYEVELLVVMGRHARDVPESKALDYVAGYCVVDDFTARDLQSERGGQWLLGKTLDGAAPIGPYFVSAAVVGDPGRLKLETRVNGELRQSSSTSDMIFSVPNIIAYVSRHFPLEPGDLILTGTPEGVVSGMPAGQRKWLKAGDRIENTIEKLGTLAFTLS